MEAVVDQVLPQEAETISMSTLGISSETITKNSVDMIVMVTVMRTNIATSHPTTGREMVQLACVEA